MIFSFLLGFIMERKFDNSCKKIRPLLKSQFNKKVKNQIDGLVHLRQNTTLSIVSLPDRNGSTSQCQLNSVKTPNILFTEENSVTNNNTANVISKSDHFTDNYNSTSTTLFTSGTTFNLPINVCDGNDSVLEDLPSIPDQLRKWAIQNKITHVALGELLLIQRQIPNLKHLPKDPRTFLQTPRKTLLREVNPGKYYHFGLETGIIDMLKKIDLSNIPDIINVAINIDGLPLSDSSLSQLYPILCLITNVDILLPLNIFCVGIYHGYDKPSDYNDLLEEFVNEAINLTLNGVIISGKCFGFKICMLLFDAVAKASVLKIKGHSGYSSCSKCTQEGEYIDYVIFPDIKFIERTDADFLNHSDPEHHTGYTILQNIPKLGLVTDIPLDYMHLICLGVMKKLLVNTWCFGKPPHKLRSRTIENISESLLSLIKYIPQEFVRKPRTIKEAKRYKATEFRQFLLYTGMIVLENNLNRRKYEHFLVLHVAIRILLSDTLMHTMTDYAEELLQHFVQSTKLIYGPQMLSHNFHNLLHLTNDARKYGNLNLFSNFSSENFLQKIKKLLRTHNNVLSQIVRRLTEESTLHNLPVPKLKVGSFRLEKEHNNGVLISGTSDPQFKEAFFSNFKLSVNLQDSCCKLKSNLIIEISNFAYCQTLNQVVVIGKKYNDVSDLYTNPCPSSLIGIHKVNSLSECFLYWPLSDVHQKLVRLPYTSGFVVIPLLHINE